MKLRSVIMAGMVAGFALVASAPSFAQSLEEALISAYANNPTLQAKRAQLRGTDESVPQALSEWRPQVIASGSTGIQHYRNYKGIGTDRNQSRQPRSMGVEVSQSLFRGFRTLNATDRAEFLVLAGRSELAATEQSVLLSSVRSYMDVVRDQAVLELNVSNEQVLRRQLEATRDRFRVGEITRTDVHQAEARVAKAEADRIEAENNLEATRATFHNVVGIVPERLSSPDAPADLPLNKEEAVKRAVTGHPNIHWFEFETQAAEKFADQVKGELLPSLNLTGKVSTDHETSSEDSHTRTLEAKLNLTVPLYQKGAVYSRLREARQQSAQNRHKVDKERRDAREKAMRAWEALDSARARSESFRAQIRAAETALEGVEREASVGSRTVLDVLDAEQEVLDAKVSLVRTMRDEMVAIFELKEAMGDLTADKLGLRVEMYLPDDHYNEVRDRWFGGGSSGDDGRNWMGGETTVDENEFKGRPR